jgi:hypothetical protein
MKAPRFAVLVVLAIAFPATGASRAEDGSLPSFFPDAEKAALVRQIDNNVPTRQAVPGGEIRRQFRWLPKDGLLWIDAEFRGDGVTTVPILDLTFRTDSRPSDPHFPRLDYREETWYGSTFWSGPDWTRVGKDWQHPGEQTPSVRCYRCPRDGRVTVSGHAYKLHKDGDGVRLSIRHGEREVWKAEIDGTDGKGVAHEVALDVKQGDAIRFLVHKRGTIFCDTTYWAPTVAYAGGEKSPAVEAFSNRQGNAGWFYEMFDEGPVSARAAAPVLRSLKDDLTLQEWTLGAGQRAELNHHDAIGWVTIDEAQGRSGIMLGIDAAGPWTFTGETTPDGSLHVALRAQAKPPCELPKVVLAAYDGPWTASLSRLRTIVGAANADAALGPLRSRLRAAHSRATASLDRAPDLDLLLMAQSEWRRDDRLVETIESYRGAVADHLERAQRLLANLDAGLSSTVRSKQATRLEQLSRRSRQPGLAIEDWRSLYLQARLLKRDVALHNPLLRFEHLLFAKRVPPSYSHHVGQYFGWRQRPGGGLFLLDRPGQSLAVRDLVAAQLPAGSFLEPNLSRDAQRVVFSYVDCSGEPPASTALPVNELGPDTRYFHIYEIGVNGSGLRQLTRGPYDDLMPAYLPDGGIVFSSTRRRGYSRCFGPNFSRRWHSYTLHRMAEDGSALRILSPNDVNEWFPAVSQDGSILFARWDYIDRDAVTHQNLWRCVPTGATPSPSGATPRPGRTARFRRSPCPGVTRSSSSRRPITRSRPARSASSTHPWTRTASTRSRTSRPGRFRRPRAVRSRNTMRRRGRSPRRTSSRRTAPSDCGSRAST